MAVKYRITSAVTDDTPLSVHAECSEQIGTRKDEDRKDIPIWKCQKVTAVILIMDLPKTEQVNYIKTQIVAAYDALPDETLVKSLIGKTWSS